MMNKNNSVKVIWIVDHLGYEGILHGAGKYYLNTIPNFDKSVFDITLCVVRKEDQLTSIFKSAGIKIIHLNRSKYDPRTLLDLIKICKNEKIKLIHTHGYGSDNFGRVIAKILRIPSIIHAHDNNSNYPTHQKIADILLRSYTNKAIAISNSVKESCIAIRKIDTEKLIVLNNGVELEKFQPEENVDFQNIKNQFNINSKVKVIGTVARLRKEKGIEYLIESSPFILKKFPNTVFLIAGDGPLREELENKVEKLNVKSNFIFAGFYLDIPSILSIIDIFVAPSINEGLGLGIIEAMSMGKPIVASNVGGIKEILTNNKSGLLVQSENPELLADKINCLLDDENFAKTLAKNAQLESRKYDNNLHVKRLENIYLDFIKNNA
ncbi:MAG: glycosyltransferase family 4 protein [Melioribacteraceae bacterium]